MKKIILVSIVLISSLSVFSQNKFEKIKALKIAYITDKVGLTPEEAEVFWPIYNKFEERLHLLKVEERHGIKQKLKDEGGIDVMSESDAKKLKEKIQKLRNEIFTLENEKFAELDKVLSAKKMVKLYGAEESFKNKLLQMYKGQHRGGGRE